MTDDNLALRHELRQAYGNWHLDHPVEDILRRGNQLRRNRRTPAVAATLALAAAATVIATQTFGSPAALAGWTPGPRVLTADDQATILASCQQHRPPLPPLAIADVRGNFAVLLLTDGVRIATCSRFDHDSGWTDGGGTGPDPVQQRAAVTTGRGAVSIEAAGDLTVHDNHAASVYGWVAPDVTRVVVTADGHTTMASVHDGAFVAWWPHSGDRSAGGRLTAFSGSGQPLTTLPFSTQ